MILDSIEASALAIPFVAMFKHASATRDCTQTIWIEVRTQDGTIGFGEGCPREYVTGESIGTAQAFVAKHRSQWTDQIHDIGTLRNWIASHRFEIDANPAAWTAVEIAVLDLLGKEACRSVEALLGLPALSGCFRYTAVLGDAPFKRFERQLIQYLQAGFRDFKIKLSGQPGHDLEKAQVLAFFGISSRAVRADANNLWADPDAAIRYLESMSFPFFAMEEPVRAGDYAGMRRVAAALSTKIVLDESLLRADQFAQLGADPDLWIANVRVSKMGGLVRSLEAIDRAREIGVPVIVGAHVGETSVLTRAGLTVASAVGDTLIAQEGAFGTHLLAYDVVDSPIMFGHAGELNVASLSMSDHGGFSLQVRK